MPVESKRLLAQARQGKDAGSVWDGLVGGFGVGEEEVEHFIEEERNVQERVRQVQKEEENLKNEQRNFRCQQDEGGRK